jgi:hypothetical protein
MLHNSGVESFNETYPESLTAVIAANGASTKYWLSSVNTYVNEIFPYVIFSKLTKRSTNMFSLYVVLCVDGV